MNILGTQRITISLPAYLYYELKKMLNKGDLSHFVAEATEAKLLEKKLKPKDPIKAFFAHKKDLSKLTDKQIMVAIHEGRT